VHCYSIYSQVRQLIKTADNQRGLPAVFFRAKFFIGVVYSSFGFGSAEAVCCGACSIDQ
jgi:hypothetical protein